VTLLREDSAIISRQSAYCQWYCLGNCQGSEKAAGPSLDRRSRLRGWRDQGKIGFRFISARFRLFCMQRPGGVVKLDLPAGWVSGEIRRYARVPGRVFA